MKMLTPDKNRPSEEGSLNMYTPTMEDSINDKEEVMFPL